MAVKYLVEGHFFNDPSFLMAYTKEEIEWIRSGGPIPQSILDSEVIDLEEMEEEGGRYLSSPQDRISVTSHYAYLGNYQDLPSLKKYVWSEFTGVLLL